MGADRDQHLYRQHRDQRGPAEDRQWRNRGFDPRRHLHFACGGIGLQSLRRPQLQWADLGCGRAEADRLGRHHSDREQQLYRVDLRRCRRLDHQWRPVGGHGADDGGLGRDPGGQGNHRRRRERRQRNPGAGRCRRCRHADDQRGSSARRELHPGHAVRSGRNAGRKLERPDQGQRRPDPRRGAERDPDAGRRLRPRRLSHHRLHRRPDQQRPRPRLFAQRHGRHPDGDRWPGQSVGGRVGFQLLGR
ncbi:hypothetical protein D3C80_925450 [compost metagenome]